MNFYIAGALVIAVVAIFCVTLLLPGYQPGGARNKEEIRAIAAKLRSDCVPNGIGIDTVHGGGLRKVEIFKCPDGTIGFVPFGYGE